MKKVIIFLIAIFLISACKKDNPKPIAKNLTIFFFNDQQGQINNFSKIKYIIDKEKQNGDVIVCCAGDIFSGNPVVDNYEEMGYPMIDLMNKVGVDISVIGNHEFDYGESTLADRIEQANFDFICANVNMENSVIPQPLEYKTINAGDLKITFLGLLETNGKANATIPSTHPLKIKNISFERPENVVSQYSNIKEQQNADLYIALTHLGYNGYNGAMGDIQLAQQFPYFDLIIGGHSNDVVNALYTNNIPIFQAGSYLEYLGKIELEIKNKKIKEINSELIDLNTYPNYDTEIQANIDEYNNNMADELNEVIGYSHLYHEKYQLGCFYTDALRERLNVDITFQNHGGIRSTLDEGDITVGEIYEIDPFHNKAVIFSMTASEIKNFLLGANSGFYYSGIQIDQVGEIIELYNLNGTIIPDTATLTLGINDYIPAVNDNYFPENGNIQTYTTAEALLYYLQNINDQVNYPSCNCYFRYQ